MSDDQVEDFCLFLAALGDDPQANERVLRVQETAWVAPKSIPRKPPGTITWVSRCTDSSTISGTHGPWVQYRKMLPGEAVYKE